VVGLATIVDLEEVDVLVTDDGLPEDARKVVQDRMGRLVIAPRVPA
jgi:DeoR/GlpR family transcriptional regulator of sugar metabolism